MSFGFVGKGFQSVRGKVVDLIGQKMEQGLAQGVSLAKELVRVDTGQTQASIGYTYDKATMTGTIHADTRWAYWIEVGTRRMPARPYLRPALAEVGTAFGLANVKGQFANLPQQYHEKARAHLGTIKGGRKLAVGPRAWHKR